eukprot:365049-Chlamydomonas_euryale.AAC.4
MHAFDQEFFVALEPALARLGTARCAGPPETPGPRPSGHEVSGYRGLDEPEALRSWGREVSGY